MSKKLSKGIGGWGPKFVGAITGSTAAKEAQEQAAKQQAAIAAQQALLAQNAQALQANGAVENTVQAEAGGGAASVDTSAEDLRRKRAVAVATTLGV